MANVEKDFAEFFALLNKHHVKYCIVGAYAFGFHAVPRYTKDLDIFVEPTVTNAERIIAVLHDFGFESLQLTVEDFSRLDQIIQLGYEPLRIDLITSIGGCDFPTAWATKETDYYGSEPVYFLGYDALVLSKQAAGRPQDLADLEKLQKIKKGK